ncbi:MexX family efflux pump subunit [Betaproteobacteria bacterium]|nr:MexX family efflux pump subunit [Betaproteobacteria bacterium]GHU31050.1 MexX family efflux pump subunit [Betaproteobacteria bacterium]
MAQEGAGGVVVSVLELQTRDFTYTQEFAGRVEGVQNVQVRVQADGVLLSRHYREGAWVNKGDLLFRIDDAEYRAQFERADAVLKQARATRVNAERNYERAKELKKLDSISEREYDMAESAWVAAGAELAGAEAAVNSARLKLGQTQVRAPISGYADMARIQEGSLVAAQSQQDSLLTSISNTRDVRVLFHVPAARVRALQNLSEQKLAVFKDPVQAVVVTEDGLEYPHKGRMSFGSGVVSRDSGSMAARAVFPNREGRLAAGQLVRIRLDALEFKQALLVPQSAVQYLQNGPVVAIVNAGGKVEFAPLQAQGPFNGYFVLTASDKLKAGVKLIVEGVNKVRPDMPVTTKPYTGAR